MARTRHFDSTQNNNKMLIISRALTLIALGAAGVRGQSCPPSNDNGQCDWDPINPYSCGADYSCAYSTMCHAEAAGYNIENDCCQAPQPSACGMIFMPLECGSKKCPYNNLCIAELAGYTEDQCSAPPPECPEGSKDCSGDPSNPYTCGLQKCPYDTICEVTDAGFDLGDDCCQDTRGDPLCTKEMKPVSCGRPGGKQCGYDNQCLADAAGYNEKQCCAAVPDGIACASIYAPVECGNIPCVYASQCEATAAGYSESDCCPQADGACTAENDPVACGQHNCLYGSQSCADLAGFSSSQCCNQPKEAASCGMNYAPLACSSANCIYDNCCIAELAGFDCPSCVPLPSTQGVGNMSDTSGAAGKTNAAAVAAILFPFFALA